MPDEVIVVNNNSTDETVKIALFFPFVRVINEKKQGIVYARNAGFDAAKSDIIGRIDADTLIPKDWTKKVKELYASKAHQNHAFTGGGYFYNLYFPPRRIGSWIHAQLALHFNLLLLGHYILWGSNMAISQSQWRAVHDSVCLQNDIHEDIDLAIHLHRIGYKITYRADLSVGVAARRILDDRAASLSNMLWWPRSLRAHGNKRWVLSWLGAYGLYLLSFLLWAINKPIQALPSRRS